MHSSRLYRAALLVVIPVVLATLACGSASTVVTTKPTATATAVPPTATPLPSATVNQVTISQHFADSKSGGTAAPCGNGDPLINGDCGETVTATCASGDVLLGGGWLLDDFLAFVTSSYPASASAWTVTAHDEGQDGGSHPFTITVYAECLHANFDAGVTTVSSTPSIPADSIGHTVTLNCPTGTVPVGGGFRGTAGTDQTIPATGGWTADLSVQQGGSAHPSLYALCAAKHLTASAVPSTTAHPLLGTGADLTVSCPAATLLTSGGVHTIGFGTLTKMQANSAQTQWLVTISRSGVVGGPPSSYTIVDYAVCVTVS